MNYLDFNIRYAQLPYSVEGVTIPNDDGTFDIYINSRLCESRQQAALQHEIEHITKDHFYDDIKSIETVESEAG